MTSTINILEGITLNREYSNKKKAKLYQAIKRHYVPSRRELKWLHRITDINPRVLDIGLFKTKTPDEFIQILEKDLTRWKRPNEYEQLVVHRIKKLFQEKEKLSISFLYMAYLEALNQKIDDIQDYNSQLSIYKPSDDILYQHREGLFYRWIWSPLKKLLFSTETQRAIKEREVRAAHFILAVIHNPKNFIRLMNLKREEPLQDVCRLLCVMGCQREGIVNSKAVDGFDVGLERIKKLPSLGRNKFLKKLVISYEGRLEGKNKQLQLIAKQAFFDVAPLAFSEPEPEENVELEESIVIDAGVIVIKNEIKSLINSLEKDVKDYESDRDIDLGFCRIGSDSAPYETMLEKIINRLDPISGSGFASHAYQTLDVYMNIKQLKENRGEKYKQEKEIAIATFKELLEFLYVFAMLLDPQDIKCQPGKEDHLSKSPENISIVKTKSASRMGHVKERGYSLLDRLQHHKDKDKLRKLSTPRTEKFSNSNLKLKYTSRYEEIDILKKYVTTKMKEMLESPNLALSKVVKEAIAELVDKRKIFCHELAAEYMILKFDSEHKVFFQVIIDALMPNAEGVNDSVVTRYQKIIQSQMVDLTEEKENFLSYVTDLRQALKLEFAEPAIRQFKM